MSHRFNHFYTIHRNTHSHQVTRTKNNSRSSITGARVKCNTNNAADRLLNTVHKTLKTLDQVAISDAFILEST